MGMKRSMLFFLFFFALLFEGRGQDPFDEEEAGPIFQSWGASTFIDLINGPPTVYQQNPNAPERGYQAQGFSYLTAAYRGRVNLVEFYKGLALSSSLTPALGVSLFTSERDGRVGFLHFNLPMLLHLEIGANATREAKEKDFGLIGGIGYEFHAAPLIVSRNNISLPRGTQLKNTWLQPVYSLGIRYRRGGRLVEVGLKYGQGSGKFVGGQKVQAQTIRVMAYYFI